MFCGKCGASIPEDSKFCESCGAAVENKSTISSMYASINSENDFAASYNGNEPHTNNVPTSNAIVNKNNAIEKPLSFPANRNCGTAVRLKIWGWILTPISGFFLFIALISLGALGTKNSWWIVFPLIGFAIGIFAFVDSGLVQKGTIYISKDEVFYRGRAGNVKINTNDISAVQLSGSRVNIIHNGGHLSLSSWSSGKISEEISKRSKITRNGVSQSNADEIRKYKELLDIGAITQEQYNNVLKKYL